MQGLDSSKIALAQMKETFAKNLHQKLVPITNLSPSAVLSRRPLENEDELDVG